MHQNIGIFQINQTYNITAWTAEQGEPDEHFLTVIIIIIIIIIIINNMQKITEKYSKKAFAKSHKRTSLSQTASPKKF